MINFYLREEHRGTSSRKGQRTAASRELTRHSTSGQTRQTSKKIVVSFPQTQTLTESQFFSGSFPSDPIKRVDE